jgi:hypothetical protein
MFRRNSCLHPLLSVMTETACSSETLLTTYHLTRHYKETDHRRYALAFMFFHSKTTLSLQYAYALNAVNLWYKNECINLVDCFPARHRHLTFNDVHNTRCEGSDIFPVVLKMINGIILFLGSIMKAVSLRYCLKNKLDYHSIRPRASCFF